MPDIQSEEKICPCPGIKCKTHGQCYACIQKHKRAGNVPYCLRETVEAICRRRIEKMQQTQ